MLQTELQLFQFLNQVRWTSASSFIVWCQDEQRKAYEDKKSSDCNPKIKVNVHVLNIVCLHKLFSIFYVSLNIPKPLPDHALFSLNLKKITNIYYLWYIYGNYEDNILQIM